MSHNVSVGIGCDGLFCAAHNLPFDIAWVLSSIKSCVVDSSLIFSTSQAAIESGGRITEEEALAMGSTNILKLLGVKIDDGQIDLVATRGGDLFSMNHKVAAIVSPRQGVVHLFET